MGSQDDMERWLVQERSEGKEMTFWVGFDVGKTFHWLSVLDEAGEVVHQALIALAGRRVNVVWAMLRDGSPYIEQSPKAT